MTIARIKPDYASTGWRTRLQDNYDGDFEQFSSFNEGYDLIGRLGYEGVEEAWEDNPVIQGSTDPRDLRKTRDDELLDATVDYLATNDDPRAEELATLIGRERLAKEVISHFCFQTAESQRYIRRPCNLSILHDWVKGSISSVG